MSVLGTPGSPTYAVTLSGIEGIVGALPDNTSNAISAADVRNSMLTVWEEIESVGASVSAASVGATLSGAIKTTYAVGGITAGYALGAVSMYQALQYALYAYNPPSMALSANPATIERGNAAQIVQVSWGLTSGKNAPVSSSIQGPVQTRTLGVPSAQAYTYGVATFGIASYPSTSVFTFSVNDTGGGAGGNNVATVSVRWADRMYWGSWGTTTPPTSVQILALTGAGVGTGNILATSHSYTLDGIDGNGEYLVFAWPASFGEPLFKANGFVTTGFTKISSAMVFTNSYSATASYDVWLSDSKQNSSIDQFQII